MKRDINYVTSPNIVNVDKLYESYISIPGNELKTNRDFMEFLSVNSLEREDFLKKYSEYEVVQSGAVSILIVSAL